MGQKHLGMGFGILVICLSSWFIFKAGNPIFSYFKLQQQTTATIESLNIERKKDNFLLTANFLFEHAGNSYQGKGVLRKYPNIWAAENGLKRCQTKSCQIWFNPKQPETAVLEKKFPYKPTISALLLLSIGIYFIALSQMNAMQGRGKHNASGRT